MRREKIKVTIRITFIIRVVMKVKLRLETMASNWLGDNFVSKKKWDKLWYWNFLWDQLLWFCTYILTSVGLKKKKKQLFFFQTNLSTYFLNVPAINFYFWIIVNYYVFCQSVIRNKMYLNSLSIQNVSYWKDRKSVPHLCWNIYFNFYY